MISFQQAILELFNLIQLVLVVRILLSWFPNINWWNQPFKLLHDVTEPILAPFRKLIPPIGGLDLSPIAAFLVLGMIQTVIVSFL